MNLWIGNSVVADKKYTLQINSDAGAILSMDIQSSVASYLSNTATSINFIVKDSVITLNAKHFAGVDTVDLLGGAVGYTHIEIRLISKD